MDSKIEIKIEIFHKKEEAQTRIAELQQLGRHVTWWMGDDFDIRPGKRVVSYVVAWF